MGQVHTKGAAAAAIVLTVVQTFSLLQALSWTVTGSFATALETEPLTNCELTLMSCCMPPASAPGSPVGSVNVTAGAARSRVISACPAVLAVFLYLYSRYTVFKPFPPVSVNCAGLLVQFELV